MSFIKQLADLVEKVPEGLGHARDEVVGLLNPNRRHDDPEEIRRDEIRAQINASHRFNSFATERTENTVKWHIDGHDYMWAVSEMLDSAKECIFIQDWWLTPELYLRRPPAQYPEWRLDKLLQRKAQEGVKVHVIVYKEVTQTMSMSSKHTKSTLDALHPNVVCLRHPDHIGSKDTVEFWSHHEKVVVVDNHYACIGGLDLCFGRWDTHTHPLADVHPTDFSLTLFPGQDYNNARVMDFKDVFNYASNTLSSLETARMPWHDVHMTLTGPVVLDIVQHFTERWNEIKKRKYQDQANVVYLALPHNVHFAPNEAVAQHPERETWHQLGHRYKQRWMGLPDDEQKAQNLRYAPRRAPGMKVQVVRSVSDWSHGVLTERSIQNAYRQLIQEAEHFIYIENQFFISTTYDKDEVKNQIAGALVERIIRAAKAGQKFQVIVVIPEVPGFSGNLKDEGSLKIIMAAQYRTINRGGHSIYEEIRKAGYEPMDYIRFYHLRSYDRINAPLSTYIQKIEAEGGVKYHEALVALARKWIGREGGDQKTVTYTLPVPTKEGIVVTDTKTPPKTETVPIPESESEAHHILEKFERAAKRVRGDNDVADNVAQHMLHDRTSLLEEKWLGTEQEELDAYVSELLYIHTKLMIVDDRRVIMGSANINDRSQKGDGDSEIALVVEDADMVDATMNGQPYPVARFAASLRRKLFREHLGLIPPQQATKNEQRPTDFMRPAPHPNPDEMNLKHDALVADPLSVEMLTLWNDTAKKNREIFTEVFRPVPTNLVRDWKAYDSYVPKVKTGHVVPGIPLDRVKKQLAQVRGALVEAPLDFLIDDKDFVDGKEWKGLNPTLPIYI
ncbi:Phospholipase [Mycena indigotica]|uniref:Phospholipase n=1 Tax=Mycena indigotica TaxID=2126181 RepID=A0A8H6T6M5_9AGAR|nr:Phospholipase [Mycena indigotica]KAF7311749.1 Phospholipase [Mycena indigotica]